VEPVRRAVIDVGTNSVKLLVADLLGHDVRPVLEDSKQTRLGRGFYDTRRLQPEPIAKTAAAVAAFAVAARECGSGSVRVIATSAARDAVNRDALLSAIEQASGLKVEVISGDREAEWVFQGVTTDPAYATKPILLLDVGGGSTEFILGQGGRATFQSSFPLGSVRLMERFPHVDPPRPQDLDACRRWISEFLAVEVRPRLEPALRRERAACPGSEPPQLVGTGGTASILACIDAGLSAFDRRRIESTRLSLDGLRRHLALLWSLPLAKRREIVGLPPKRADVILTGVLIYEAVMEQFGLPELRVSTRGLRFAAVMDRA
jgi:exopolyphosphatase/guanosine-5'-triphosphate,3'-diphosphate pyrophosphatase